MRRSKRYQITRLVIPLCLVRLFASLAADKSSLLPYSRDMADQRRKYGDSMLRKCDEHLASQKQWEADAHAKLEAARQKRQQEKEQQQAMEVSARPATIVLEELTVHV